METVRFSSSPDSIKIKGGYADCNHPSARAFSIINGRCILMTQRIHPFIFHALQGCQGKDGDGIAAILDNFGVSAYPDLPTKGDLDWFEANWTGDIGRLRELTCSGRVWKNIKSDNGAVLSIISFWSAADDTPGSIMPLILNSMNLQNGQPVYIEFIDSTEPIMFNLTPSP